MFSRRARAAGEQGRWKFYYSAIRRAVLPMTSARLTPSSTASLFADNTTLASPSPLGVSVPFESQPGRGLFGNAGKNVKPHTILNIPPSLGLFQRTLCTHRSDRFMMPSEVMFAGFVAALIEEDSTPANAVTAGHQELGPSLREEILAFYLQHQRFPTTEEIAAIKNTVSNRVEAAIRNKVSCWDGFWSSQDKFIGVAADENTLFTASEIRALSGKGRTVRQTPISGSEYSLQWTGSGRNSHPVAVLREHHYVLHWSITVQPVRPAAEVRRSLRNPASCCSLRQGRAYATALGSLSSCNSGASCAAKTDTVTAARLSSAEAARGGEIRGVEAPATASVDTRGARTNPCVVRAHDRGIVPVPIEHPFPGRASQIQVPEAAGSR